MNTAVVDFEAEDPIRRAAGAALADVDALGATGEDRSILLKALLEVRLSRSIGPVSPSSPAPSDFSHAPPAATSSAHRGEGGDVLDIVSATLKIDRDLTELVYSLQDGEPHVVVSPKKIASNKAQATRELAQLVAASRQAAGLDEWTPVGIVRKVVTDYGRLDSGNFATYLQGVDSVALLRGKGQQREIKITRPGFEATGDLVRKLLGVDG
jgi:hypothetical protein